MNEKYTMSLSLNVLNHLGINLYSSIPAVLSEIVANSWDADAETVKVNIENDIITIEDDGVGMNVEDINLRFLHVGHQKRSESTESKKFKRKYMGRKGIGKLSMFSIAKEIDVVSKKLTADGTYEINGLRMNVDEISSSIQSENSSYDNSYHPIDIPCDINDINITGTKIILKNLKVSTSSLTKEYIKKRVARRFAIIGDEYNFSVIVNNEQVSVSDRDYFHKLDYIWYYGDESEKYADCSNKTLFKDKRKNLININGTSFNVTGWIGSVENSGDLRDGSENLNKIAVLCRGKLGQEDILASYSEGGLYSKYLIGEINADFLDDDLFEDMAVSSRQGYRIDDERFTALQAFIQNELKHIQSKWTELRNESGEKKAKELVPAIKTWFSTLSGDDKSYAKKMFGKVNQVIVDDEKKKEILKYSVLAFEKLKYTNHLSAIDNINIESMDIIKDLFIGLDEVEATLYYQIVKERISVIKKFQEITDENKLEQIIQEYLFSHLWLLDPSWERAESTEFMERSVLNALNVVCDKLSAEEKKARLDLGYRKSAGKHIIIELKRAERIVKFSEMMDQVMKYNSALTKALSKSDGTIETFEILFVVGKPIDGNDSLSHRKYIADTLKPSNARVIYYKELIESSYSAYKEYLDANKKTQPLIDMFNQIESDLDI